MALKDWPPVFTLCLPFVGCFGGLAAYLHTGSLEDKVWVLKGLLLGLCVGLVVDLAVALLDWLCGEQTEPAKPDTQPPTKVM